MSLDNILDELGQAYHNSYPDNKALKTAKSQLKHLIIEEKIKELDDILLNAYDDMHKTYDYDRIAEKVIERSAELNKELQKEIGGVEIEL